MTFALEFNCSLELQPSDDGARLKDQIISRINDADTIGVTDMHVQFPEATDTQLLTVRFWLFFDDKNEALSCKDSLFSLVFDTHPKAIHGFTCAVMEAEITLRGNAQEVPRDGIPYELALTQVLRDHGGAAIRLKKRLGLTHLTQLTQLTSDELKQALNIGGGTVSWVLDAMREQQEHCTYPLMFMPAPRPLHTRQLNLIPIRCASLFLNRGYVTWDRILEAGGICTLADLRVASTADIHRALSKVQNNTAALEYIQEVCRLQALLNGDATPSDETLRIPISMLFGDTDSQRAITIASTLEANGIATIGELLQKSTHDIYALHGLGGASLGMIQSALAVRGLRLK